jgi:hypothetical protein
MKRVAYTSMPMNHRWRSFTSAATSVVAPTVLPTLVPTLPPTGSVAITAWAAFVEQAKVIVWKERDAKVTVFGESSAVVTYYYDANVEMGGKAVELSGRDMFFMVKEDGQWWAVADQFSGYPTEGSG